MVFQWLLATICLAAPAHEATLCLTLHSIIFLYRTFMDFVIAVGHILAGIASLAGSEHDPRRKACMALGTVNEFALVASNLWYVFLAVDLIRAIRNPFR